MANRHPRQPAANANQDVIRMSDNSALLALVQRQEEIDRGRARLREEEAKLAADLQETLRRGLEKRVQEGEVAQRALESLNSDPIQVLHSLRNISLASRTPQIVGPSPSGVSVPPPASHPMSTSPAVAPSTQAGIPTWNYQTQTSLGAPSRIVQPQPGYQSQQLSSSVRASSTTHQAAGPSSNNFRATSQASNMAYLAPGVHPYQPTDSRGQPMSNQIIFSSQNPGVQVEQGTQPFYLSPLPLPPHRYPTQIQYPSHRYHVPNPSTSSLSGALGQPQQSFSTPYQIPQSTNPPVINPLPTTTNTQSQGYTNTHYPTSLNSEVHHPSTMASLERSFRSNGTSGNSYHAASYMPAPQRIVTSFRGSNRGTGAIVQSPVVLNTTMFPSQVGSVNVPTQASNSRNYTVQPHIGAEGYGAQRISSRITPTPIDLTNSSPTGQDSNGIRLSTNQVAESSAAVPSIGLHDSTENNANHRVYPPEGFATVQVQEEKTQGKAKRPDIDGSTINKVSSSAKNIPHSSSFSVAVHAAVQNLSSGGSVPDRDFQALPTPGTVPSAPLNESQPVVHSKPRKKVDIPRPVTPQTVQNGHADLADAQPRPTDPIPTTPQGGPAPGKPMRSPEDADKKTLARDILRALGDHSSIKKRKLGSQKSKLEPPMKRLALDRHSLQISTSAINTSMALLATSSHSISSQASSVIDEASTRLATPITRINPVEGKPVVSTFGSAPRDTTKNQETTAFVATLPPQSGSATQAINAVDPNVPILTQVTGSVPDPFMTSIPSQRIRFIDWQTRGEPMDSFPPEITPYPTAFIEEVPTPVSIQQAVTSQGATPKTPTIGTKPVIIHSPKTPTKQQVLSPKSKSFVPVSASKSSAGSPNGSLTIPFNHSIPPTTVQLSTETLGAPSQSSFNSGTFQIIPPSPKFTQRSTAGTVQAPNSLIDLPQQSTSTQTSPSKVAVTLVNDALPASTSEVITSSSPSNSSKSISYSRVLPQPLQVYVLVPPKPEWLKRMELLDMERSEEIVDDSATEVQDSAAEDQDHHGTQDRHFGSNSVFPAELATRAADDSEKRLRKRAHVVTHVEPEKSRPTRTVFICQWTDCTRRFKFADVLRQHLQNHVRKRLFCIFLGCNEQFAFGHQLLSHYQSNHQPPNNTSVEPLLRPLAKLKFPHISELPARLPNVHMYQMICPPVIIPSISPERHQKLGPWVLRNIYGPVNTGAIRPNSRYLLRARRAEEQVTEVAPDPSHGLMADEYDFLEYQAQFTDYPRYLDPLDSTKVSDLIDQGLTLFSDGRDSVDLSNLQVVKRERTDRPVLLAQDEQALTLMGNAGYSTSDPMEVSSPTVGRPGEDLQTNDIDRASSSTKADDLLLVPFASQASETEMPMYRSTLFLPDEEAIDELLWTSS